MFVLPMTMAPASVSRWTTDASAAGTWSEKSREPRVVRSPAVSTQSLTVMGTPCSGPIISPVAAAAWTLRARSSAPSLRVTIALSRPLTSSIRCRCARTTSTGETSPSRTSRASAVASLE